MSSSPVHPSHARAAVPSPVAANTAARAASGAEVRGLVRLGHRSTWRARGASILIICGVVGSGKTALAERLAAISGRPHISSDLHAPAAREEIYRELGREAAAAVRHGEGAIVDATFHREPERFAFEEGMGEELTTPLVVECTAPTCTLLRRVEARHRGRSSASDVDLVLRQLGERDPFHGRWARAHLTLRTDLPLDRQVAEVESFIDRR